MADILTFNNSWLRVGSGLLNNELPPVAAKTMRFRFSNTSFDPRTDTVPYSSDYDFTWTKVADGIYDFTYDHAEWLYTTSGSQWSIIGAVRSPSNIKTKPLDTAATVGTLEVIDSNLSGVTKMGNFGNNLQHTIVSAKLRNVGNLTTAAKLFQNTPNLVTVDIDELSSASSLSTMFQSCTSLTSANISAPVATSSTTMFLSCTSLTSATVSAPSVTNSKDMFKSCTSLTSATVDLTSATTTEGLFYGCSSLVSTSLQLSSALTNIKSMFNGCTALTSAPAGLNATTTANVINMNNAFTGCTSLTTAPSLDYSSAVDVFEMFKNTAITAVPTMNTVDGVLTDVRSAFLNCKAVEQGALAMYNVWSSYTTVPNIASYPPFKNCGADTVTGAAELALIPTSWGGGAA